MFIKVCMGKYNTIEAESKLSMVNSIHFPKVIDSNFEGINYVVNEYIEFGGGIVSRNNQKEIVKQSCEILDDLNNAGIINRDVNHENLILNNQGILILIDFGWAVFADNNYKKSIYPEIENMLNKRYRHKNRSFDDAYSMYHVLKDYYQFDEELLQTIENRIGRLCIEGNS